jgi:hypothetical protein
MSIGAIFMCIGGLKSCQEKQDNDRALKEEREEECIDADRVYIDKICKEVRTKDSMLDLTHLQIQQILLKLVTQKRKLERFSVGGKRYTLFINRMESHFPKRVKGTYREYMNFPPKYEDNYDNLLNTDDDLREAVMESREFAYSFLQTILITEMIGRGRNISVKNIKSILKSSRELDPIFKQGGCYYSLSQYFFKKRYNIDL